MTPTHPTEGVECSPQAVELFCGALETIEWRHVSARDAAALLRALSSRLSEMEGLLRDVGRGGRFNLTATNGDEADAWYERRDDLLGALARGGKT